VNGWARATDPIDVQQHRVAVEQRGHVLLIRMERTGKRNAVDAAMTAALDSALNLLDDSPELRCGVLSGGPDVFCAGTDLEVGPGRPTARGGPYGLVARRRSTPLIAAVEGVAFGGGFEVALACDIVVAARSARLGLPEVTHGVIANCGALFRADRALPLTAARQLLLTGLPMSAARGHSVGLVGELVDDGQAEEAAVAMAEVICANSPVAVTATLQALQGIVAEADDRGWEITAQADATVAGSADRAEGIAAFLERRTARWTGH
jgi:enoyl-CoA hydratase/carnithine racemase